jgi:hypothetical protein
LLYIKDPLCFKESIFIALEALANNKYVHLEEHVGSITSGRVSFDFSNEVEESFKECISEFKETKTFFWLREDFKKVLYDIEIQLNKRVS